MTATSTSFAVAGGRGLPVPTKAVVHSRVKPVPWKPAYWSQPPTPQPEVQEVTRTRPVTRTVRPATRNTPSHQHRSPIVRKGRYPADTSKVDVRALVRAYTEEGLGLRAAGQTQGIGDMVAKRLLEQAGVTIRPVGHVPKRTLGQNPPAEINLDDLKARYLAGASLRDLERHYSSDRNRISRMLKAAEVELRPRGGPRKRRDRPEA